MVILLLLLERSGNIVTKIRIEKLNKEMQDTIENLENNEETENEDI